MANNYRIAIVFSILAAISQGAQAAAKDESRLSPDTQVAQQAPVNEPLKLPGADTGAGAGTAPAQDGTSPDATAPDGGPAAGEDLTAPDPSPNLSGGDSGAASGDLSLGEIPDIKSMELTVDIARRAIDSYILVKTKYAGSDLESSDNLQEFVDKNPQGKVFEADIKAAGFATVDDWNVAITTLGFAYTGVTDDPSADIKQQIAEIETDAALAQDMKDRMIASLNAMIPSENNRKVVEELMKDPAYAEKLKQLETEEE